MNLIENNPGPNASVENQIYLSRSQYYTRKPARRPVSHIKDNRLWIEPVVKAAFAIFKTTMDAAWVVRYAASSKAAEKVNAAINEGGVPDWREVMENEKATINAAFDEVWETANTAYYAAINAAIEEANAFVGTEAYFEREVAYYQSEFILAVSRNDLEAARKASLSLHSNARSLRAKRND